MFTLVIGGAASGKSEFAEDITINLPGQRIYLATMEPFDDEGRRRVEKHRQQRQGKGFMTLEQYQNLSDLTIPQNSNLLLECLGNLTANELYASNGTGILGVLQGIESLLIKCAHLTVVTNEIFSGGDEYEGDTLSYMRALGHINCVLAAQADLVVEVVCGLPNVLKGRLP